MISHILVSSVANPAFQHMADVIESGIYKTNRTIWMQNQSAMVIIKIWMLLRPESLKKYVSHLIKHTKSC